MLSDRIDPEISLCRYEWVEVFSAAELKRTTTRTDTRQL
jgi:hypothetical protein